MLEFCDKPYRFFPPKPNATVIRLAHWMNQHFILPGRNHRISEICLDGDQAIRELLADGGHLLLLPNHSTHSDPQIMSEAHRRLGIASAFMAAYDVFLRSRSSAWFMQHTGSFSVDREGSDRKALSTAIEVLKRTGSLTIFPEGNVYFTNGRVTPFLEGAAFIGIKAQKDLGAGVPVYAVPVAIHLTHLLDQRRAVIDRLEMVARRLGARVDPTAPLLEELHRVGHLALERHLAEHGMRTPGEERPIHDALERAASEIVVKLERETGLVSNAKESLQPRLRKIRSKIHQVRIARDSAVDSTTATRWADQAILALRMVGYAVNYVAENPTLDRFAETVEKLDEDIESRCPKPYGKRRATVRLCEPIDLRKYTGRGGVGALTDAVESAVQAALDQLGAENRCLGGRLFE